MSLKDPRLFWIEALTQIPALKNKRAKILKLSNATDDRLYPGYVLEKFYYISSSPKLTPYIDDLFELAHGAIELGYKPESTLYWLRTCSESEKLTKQTMSKFIDLGKIAKQKNLRPEFIYFELWGFTNLKYLTKKHILSIMQIMKYTMITNLDPYDVFHWLRVNLEINSGNEKIITELINELLNRVRTKNNPIDFLVEMQEKHFKENPTNVIKVASSIESTHIVGRDYSKKR